MKRKQILVREKFFVINLTNVQTCLGFINNIVCCSVVIIFVVRNKQYNMCKKLNGITDELFVLFYNLQNTFQLEI